MSDLISRQVAIAYAISGRTREIDGEKWIRVSEIRESLQTMPSTQRTGKWIPVSERLPEDDRQVLCCTQRKTLQKGLVIGYYSSGLERWVCGMNSNVIAWRPLPEVYQEVRSNG